MQICNGNLNSVTNYAMLIFCSLGEKLYVWTNEDASSNPQIKD